MSAPKAGCHITIRRTDKNDRLPEVRALYPWIGGDDVFLVEAVDRTKFVGRARCYAHPKGKDGPRVCFWLSQVTAFPRCEYCDCEGHTKAQATGKNCTVVAKEQADKRKAKREALKAKGITVTPDDGEEVVEDGFPPF